MSTSLKLFYQTYQGFINRVFICWLSGIAMLFVFELKNYDIHFYWRGAQNVSSDIVIVNVPDATEHIQEAVSELQNMNARLIITPVSRRESYILSNSAEVLLIPRKGFKPDSDGVIRSLKLPKKIFEHLNLSESLDIVDTALINFRGPSSTFTSIYFFELLNKKILPSNLKNKIVILNLQDQESEPYATPVGDLSPAFILANMIDNVLFDRWIRPAPLFVNIFLLLSISILIAITILYLSSNIAAIGVLVILASITSFSFFIFDQFYFWLPLSAFLVHSILCYFIFVIYKLNKKEQSNWRMEKESLYQKEMDELKRNFLSLFSHDLKTPIAKILSQVDVIERNCDNLENTKSGLQHIKRHAYELNQHVRNIIKISQIESNKFELKHENCDLNILMSQVVKSLQPLAEEKMLTIKTSLDPLFTLKLDKDLLQQILINILENAIKYSPQDANIYVRTYEEKNHVVVCVRDEGNGIPVQDQHKIWEKFSRLNDQKEGTGLGLFLVKYFVEVHGGTVFINSTPGNGAEIGFRLPIQ